MDICELSIPFDDKIHDFIFDRGIAIQKKDGTLFPVCRASLLRLTDLEIISAYNAELRGICNYYGIADNFCKLRYLAYLMEYSCLKTLAAKHKRSNVGNPSMKGNSKPPLRSMTIKTGLRNLELL